MFKQISSTDPKYLAATDILIGDMSDISNEFLLFDRPIILLANEWLEKNFPDIGIKTNLRGLENAIKRSMENSDEFMEQRKYWLEKTIYKANGKSSKRIIDTILKYSNIANPNITIIHGGDSILMSNLNAVMVEAKKRGFKVNYVKSVDKDIRGNKNDIYISAHFRYLNIPGGYNVHLDHGPKGKGAANVEISKKDYKKNNYFPLINLHITAGEVGFKRTKMQLNYLSDRAVLAGYPKADDLLRLNTSNNRRAVCQELGFNRKQPMITYAPAGEESYMKPGGSFSKEVIDKLKEIASENDYNILVKLKCHELSFVIRVLKKLKREIQKLYKEADD